MFYHHRFMFGSIDSASACAESSFVRRRRAPSLWGFGAAAGLLSFPLRARSSESDSGPESDPAKLAGELCPVPIEGALVVPEACNSDSSEAASASREPALLTVLGSDVRLEDLPGLPEQQEGLVLPQAPEGTAAGGRRSFWLILAGCGVSGRRRPPCGCGRSQRRERQRRRRRHLRERRRRRRRSHERDSGGCHDGRDGRPGVSDGGHGGQPGCLGLVLGPGRGRHAHLHGDGQPGLARFGRDDGGSDGCGDGRGPSRGLHPHGHGDRPRRRDGHTHGDVDDRGL